MIGVHVTAHQVKARWAYHELISARFGKNYLGAGPKHIHDMAAAKNPFSVLTPADHDELVKMLERGRHPEFTSYVDGSPMYRCEAWTKGQLAHTWALPVFDAPAKKKLVPYYDFYIGTPNTGAGGTAEDSDPRVAARTIPQGTPFNQAHEPVVIVGKPDQYVLVEGYFRSILFMRFGDLSQRLLAWVPFVATPRIPRPERVV